MLGNFDSTQCASNNELGALVAAGTEGSNRRTAESKSARLLNDFKAYLEKMLKMPCSTFNSLAVVSK
jgi:hypothetical protein